MDTAETQYQHCPFDLSINTVHLICSLSVCMADHPTAEEYEARLLQLCHICLHGFKVVFIHWYVTSVIKSGF